MKKESIIIFSLISLLFSCSTPLPKKMEEESEMGKKTISKTLSIDSGKYIDVTNIDVNASIITKTDFNKMVRGTYYLSPTTFITFEPKTSLCSIHCSNSTLEDYKGKVVDAYFIYDIKAASENLLYISPLTIETSGILVNEKIERVLDAPSFFLYIPLFGFGENRVYVSNTLEGEALLPSGTYWKK